MNECHVFMQLSEWKAKLKNYDECLLNVKEVIIVLIKYIAIL